MHSESGAWSPNHTCCECVDVIQNRMVQRGDECGSKKAQGRKKVMMMISVFVCGVSTELGIHVRLQNYVHVGRQSIRSPDR